MCARKNYMAAWLGLVVAFYVSSAPAAAQNERVGQVAQSAAGQVGQRQTSAQAMFSIAPTGRINNRIANRIQSRIRNRIDQNYDPQANTVLPFAVAGDQARIAGRSRR